MAVLVTVLHVGPQRVFRKLSRKVPTWIPATSAGMTDRAL